MRSCRAVSSLRIVRKHRCGLNLNSSRGPLARQFSIGLLEHFLRMRSDRQASRTECRPFFPLSLSAKAFCLSPTLANCPCLALNDGGRLFDRTELVGYRFACFVSGDNLDPAATFMPVLSDP